MLVNKPNFLSLFFYILLIDRYKFFIVSKGKIQKIRTKLDVCQRSCRHAAGSLWVMRQSHPWKFQCFLMWYIIVAWDVWTFSQNLMRVMPCVLLCNAGQQNNTLHATSLLSWHSDQVCTLDLRLLSASTPQCTVVTQIRVQSDATRRL